MKVINKMKIWGMASLILLGTTSCDDFLTRDNPKGVTDDDFWKTMNECESALGQCRSWPHGTYHYTAPNMALLHLEGILIMSISCLISNNKLLTWAMARSLQPRGDIYLVFGNIITFIFDAAIVFLNM